MSNYHPDDVIFEFYVLGDLVKVTAIDPKSMKEVSIQGPAAAGRDILKQRALQKLQYVLTKESQK